MANKPKVNPNCWCDLETLMKKYKISWSDGELYAFNRYLSERFPNQDCSSTGVCVLEIAFSYEEFYRTRR